MKNKSILMIILYIMPILAILLILSLIGNNISSQFMAEIRTGYGDFLLKHGYIEEAISEYDIAIRLNPKLIKAYGSLANLYTGTAQYELAIQECNNILSITPDPGIFALRSYDYAMENHYDNAMRDSSAAIMLASDMSFPYYVRGLVYLNKGNISEAITDETRATVLDPKDFLAFNVRGKCYAKEGLYNNAINDFIKAIDLNNNFAEPYYNVGLAYKSLSMNEKAIANFEKFISLSSDQQLIQSAKNYIEELSK